jgi:hypothetical protein
MGVTAKQDQLTPFLSGSWTGTVMTNQNEGAYLSHTSGQSDCGKLLRQTSLFPPSSIKIPIAYSPWLKR